MQYDYFTHNCCSVLNSGREQNDIGKLLTTRQVGLRNQEFGTHQ
jgi:hypothetical protein